MLKVDGKEVKEINIRTVEDNELIYTFKTDKYTNSGELLKDVYDYIQSAKRADMEMLHYKLNYYIELVTDNGIYGDYIIRKYNNRYFLK